MVFIIRKKTTTNSNLSLGSLVGSIVFTHKNAVINSVMIHFGKCPNIVFTHKNAVINSCHRTDSTRK